MNNDDATRKAISIAQGFRKLAGQGKVDLQKILGQTAVSQAAIGIRLSKDPYGKPFAPLTSRKGKPLRRTGNNLQRSWTSGQETPTTFVFGSRFKHLATHQYGAVIVPRRAPFLVFMTEAWGRVKTKRVVIPRRQMVPEADTGGLGPRWTGAFSRQVEGFVVKTFEGTGGQYVR